jgi:aryl-alcohol dehydrogenase-like predicted oxidoreductase
VRERQVAGRWVGAIGLGGAKFSLGATRPSEAQAVRTIHAALDAGVRLIDTSDIYCSGPTDVGHNERLIARALGTWSGDASSVLVATKGGQWWDQEMTARFDGSQERLRAACDASLKALGVEAIGLYLLHRLPSQYLRASPEGQKDFIESLGALTSLREAGKIRHIGLSNVNADLLRVALNLVPLAAIQNPISALRPASIDELDLCENQKLAFLAWGPLSGISAPSIDRTGPEACSIEVVARVRALRRIAATRGVSTEQVALAWELSLSQCIVALVGARRPETILDSIAAADLQLSAEELRAIEQRSDDASHQGPSEG